MFLNAWLPRILLCGATLPPLLQAGDFGRAQYVGGTVSAFSGKPVCRIGLSDDALSVSSGKGAAIAVPYSSIHTVEYGQRVSRRYAEAILVSPMLLLAKKRRHFLTIGFSDGDARQQAVVFEVGKNSIRALLAGIEAKTGRRVEFQDEDARRAGKGGS
jgi:hypothetical protein